MKKLTLALVLILCLVLCVFAFASCGPKKPASTTAGGTTPASTTAETECNHVWGEFEVDTPATCTAPGVKSKYCTICDAQDPDSITEIPKLDHIPGEEYVIDQKPNCSEKGSKSKHCTVCGQPVADTVLEIDFDSNEHVIEEWNVTEEPTLLADGSRTGTCTLCHSPVVEAYPLPVYNSKAFEGPYASGSSVVFSKTVGEISGESKTFHPTDAKPDGNDLWVEYSFLWNDTLANWNQSKSEMSLTGFKNENGSYRHLYYVYGKDGQSGDCPYRGHFDYSTYLQGYEKGHEWECAQEIGNGQPRYKAGWDSPVSRASSPYIYDEESQPVGGWHRIGIRFHQEIEINDEDDEKGVIVYTGYSELYVDGVQVWKVLLDMQGKWDSAKSEWVINKGYAGKGTADLKSNDLLLWYAKTELDENDVADEWTLYNGVYYKDHDDMIVYGSMDRFANSTEAAYASFYDVIWTCGDGFVRNVTPIADPAARTITLNDMGTEDAEDDLIVSAAIFYEVN
ncbi:MAG: hypothetical protein J6Z04_00975 [Clostridia bacterium]|nr:hypothetical protein [Clostridia bacterium]